MQIAVTALVGVSYFAFIAIVGPLIENAIQLESTPHAVLVIVGIASYTTLLLVFELLSTLYAISISAIYRVIHNGVTPHDFDKTLMRSAMNAHKASKIFE